MKKIISFSLWGTNEKYSLGALQNLQLQTQMYPDWICRFYVDNTVPKETIAILEKNAEIIMMPKSDANYGMFWRFEPLKDDTIERFIVRDTDSRLNIREVFAVREWLDSGKIFHIMRDNKWHNVVPICGAMWGATSSFIKSINYDAMLKKWIEKNQYRLFSHPRGKYFYMDQLFLADCIWPLVINKHIAHESVVSTYPGDKRPFPKENPDGSFVGQPFEE